MVATAPAPEVRGGLFARLTPHTGSPARALYLFLRTAHFLLMAVAFPLAYLAARGGAAGSGLPGWLLPLAWIGAAIWAAFHFTLHSYAYPLTVGQAFMATGIPLVNFFTTGTFSAATGGLSVVMASLLAVTLAIVAVLVVVLMPTLRERLVPQTPAWAPRLLAGLLPPLVLVLVVFGGTFRNEGLGALQLLAFSTQVVSELRLLFLSSVFAGPMDPKSERARLTEAWTPLVILCMMGSLAAFAVLVAWRS
jgi:hypothetical protein